MIGVHAAKRTIVRVFKFLRKMTGYTPKPKPFEMYNRLHKLNLERAAAQAARQQRIRNCVFRLTFYDLTRSDRPSDP